MDQTQRQRADARLEEALERAALRDPRPFFRDRLRLLKDREPEAFEEARRYAEEALLPRVAAEGSDPVAEWFAYGERLAELGGPGRTVSVHPGGRARTFAPPLHPDHLVLHLPDDTRTPALMLLAPQHLSPAQQATYDLLVEGKLALSEGAGAP
jgi:hypothetical protein